MNKSALAGISIALILPVICYFIIKNLGENALHMPRRYYYDQVLNTEKDGKMRSDTQWHRVRNFTLTDQLGRRFSLDDLKGKIVVINTFFTRCPNICPGLTRNIRKLQKSYEERGNKKVTDTSVVNFVSLSVDPERDSVAALKRFADRFAVNSDNWSMLTGPKTELYDLMLNELKIPAQDGGVIDTNFVHTERIVLLDKNHIVRGYYNGLDSVAMSVLAGDIGKLTLERDRSKPSIFRQYIPLIPLIALAPVIVLLGLWIIRRRSKFEELGV
jgi:protein SCO1